MISNNLKGNHLINESSIYLLQHAYNPVEWYPWGDAAFERSKKEDKPIILSIGYAACHWCHVMERESFEEEETANIMNEYFINIKVDREERPDIDHIYIDAVQAMTGSGGWPLNVFLTPELKPFYGGTYFPPVNAHKRLSWKEVLKRVHATYQEKKEEINEQSDRLTNHLIHANSFSIEELPNKETDIFNETTLQIIADNLLKSSDMEWGGFGKAPKFPQTFSIQYLLRHYHYTKDQNALKQAILSLNKMIYGGIYDQIGGGFARYSTDTKWQIPHFEKMLYDNALILNVLSEAYQLTGDELYATVIRQTINFLKREMLSEEGGFYSALDADSEGEEGKYYTWSKSEIDKVLREKAEHFCKYFQVTAEGNWEETNILWCSSRLEVYAKEHQLDKDILVAEINEGINTLLKVREERIKPQLDDKILLNWNALMITALCKCYEALQDESYKELAINGMNFIYNKFRKENFTLWHTYKNKIAKIDAFLDGYAYTIQALIALNNITCNTDYLNNAIDLIKITNSQFKDVSTGLYYYTTQNQQNIIVRKKELYDGATPSANAVMVNNLIYLSSTLIKKDTERDYINEIKKDIGRLKNAIINHPTSFGIWAINLQLIVQDIKEINIYGHHIQNEINVISTWYLPEKIIIKYGNSMDREKSGLSIVKTLETPVKSTVLNVCTKNICSRHFVNLTDFYNYLTKA